MLQEIVDLNLWAYLIVLTRIGTMMAFSPGFGASYVPARYRIAMAMAISFVVLPAVSDTIPPPPASATLLSLILFGEVIVGAFFAAIASILIAALQVAGTFIALFASMANALVQDAVAQQQSSVISGFLTTSALVLIFVTDLHHVILRAIVDSFTFFQPGQPLFFGDMSDSVARRVNDAFALGLRLSAPMMLVAIVYYVALGILGRLMPTLQVFFFGLPVQISMQIWVMMLAFSGMMMVFLNEFATAYSAYLAP